MELRQLEYFVAVVRHRGFTAAADALWLTQSALSQQVRRLEREVGVALLHRTSRGAEPTAAGRDLLARAEAVLAELARAREELGRHAGAVTGQVRVVATTSDAARLPAALARFHRAHPEVQLALRHVPAADAAGLVARAAADLAVVGLRGEPPAGVRAVVLGGEPLRVMAGPADALADAGRVVPADLRGLPLVLAEPGSALRARVVAACQAAGFSPVPLLEVSEPAAVRTSTGSMTRQGGPR